MSGSKAQPAARSGIPGARWSDREQWNDTNYPPSESLRSGVWCSVKPSDLECIFRTRTPNTEAQRHAPGLDVDPIPDLRSRAGEVRSFCIKDHRNVPKDEDRGPGFGEIDHYKLLQLVAFTGRDMPLCCENIFAPLLPRPADPEGVDALARRAREFLELVIGGSQS